MAKERGAVLREEQKWKKKTSRKFTLFCSKVLKITCMSYGFLKYDCGRNTHQADDSNITPCVHMLMGLLWFLFCRGPMSGFDTMNSSSPPLSALATI